MGVFFKKLIFKLDKKQKTHDGQRMSEKQSSTVAGSKQEEEELRRRRFGIYDMWQQLL